MIHPSRGLWSVMVSGRGSHLQNVLEYPEDFLLCWVVSSKRNVPAVLKARRSGCHLIYLTTQGKGLPLKGEDSFQKKNIETCLNINQLSKALLMRKVNRIFLMGFMKILPREFIQSFANIILNVHPSLLPTYPGKDSFQRALADGAPLGATVHEVNERVDDGPHWVKHRVQKKGRLERDHFFRLSLVERRIVLISIFKKKTLLKKR